MTQTATNTHKGQLHAMLKALKTFVEVAGIVSCAVGKLSNAAKIARWNRSKGSITLIVNEKTSAAILHHMNYVVRTEWHSTVRHHLHRLPSGLENVYLPAKNTSASVGDVTITTVSMDPMQVQLRARTMQTAERFMNEAVRVYDDVVEALRKKREELRRPSLHVVRKAGSGWTQHRSSIPPQTFDNVVVPQTGQIRDIVMAFDDKAIRDRQKALGKKPVLSIMLHGEPGCGKSSMVSAIANATGRDIVYVPLNEVETIDGSTRNSADCRRCSSCSRTATPSSR